MNIIDSFLGCFFIISKIKFYSLEIQIICGCDKMVSHRVKSNRSRSAYRHSVFGGNYWFLKYKWKESLSGDLMAGITMAIIQIPQGK